MLMLERDFNVIEFNMEMKHYESEYTTEINYFQLILLIVRKCVRMLHSLLK